MLKTLSDFATRLVGVDFGSSMLRLSLPPHESVLSEPNIVVRNKKTDQIIAIGKEAADLRGRIPDHFAFVQPVRNGSIEHPDFAEALLSRVAYRHRSWAESLFGQNFLTAIPTNTVDTANRSVADVFNRIGSRSVSAVSAPVAALVGVGVTVDDPLAQMVVDVGSDRTDIGVVSNRTLVGADTAEIAGNALDEGIQDYLRQESNLEISQLQAEHIKQQVAAVSGASPPQESLTVYGQDTASRLPREISVSAEDIRKAVRPAVDDITDFVQQFLQSVSSDIAADIYTHGVHLVGGTARLPGLATALTESLSLSVYEYDEPEAVIATGLGKVTQRPDLMQEIMQFDPYEINPN